MAIEEPDETRLIDVGELHTPMVDDATEQEELSDATLVVPSPSAPMESMRSPEASISTGRLATMAERFTAGLIDGVLLWCLYWAGVQGYQYLVNRTWAGPAPINLEWSGLIFHAAYLVAIFIFYFVFEGVFTATPGKWCCGLAVRRQDGGVPSLMNITVRTVFRLFDVLLGFFFVEFTRRHQRLGDIAAGTVVVKRQRAEPGSRTVGWDQIAGTTGRLIAGLIDTALLCAVGAALLFMLSDEYAFVSQWLLLAAIPVVAIIWSALQHRTHTTPGAWLLGYRLVQENGAPIGFSHALVRTLMVPLDLLAGWFALLVSPRRQRIGDLIAGTLVVRMPRQLRGAIGLLLMLGLIAGASWLAHLNPRNFRHPDFQWSFLPRTDLAPDFPRVNTPDEPFQIAGFRFAEGQPDNTRDPAAYVAGETAYFVFEVHGFRTEQHMVWIQEDLAIRYPDNTFGLKQENIIDYHQIKRLPGPLVLKNNISLPRGIPSGQYTVYVTVRDKLAGGAPLVHSEIFYIKTITPPAAEPTPAAAPSPAASEPSSSAAPSASEPSPAANPTAPAEPTPPPRPAPTVPQSLPAQQ